MKACPGCGEKFTGFEALCMVCRRTSVTHSGPEVTHKLTPAEKQRRYRERHAEKVRASNRERMRRKRSK